jgi:hypothetical protein
MSIGSRLPLSVLILSLASGVFAFACSSSDELVTPVDGGPSGDTGAAAHVADSGHDAADATADAPVVCDYPPYANPVGCPTQYAYSLKGKPCAPVGLQCAYPGMGDIKSDGCGATAMMWCYGDAGLGADAADSGDAGTGTWTIAQ